MWSISWLHYKLTTKRRKLHLVQWLENAQKQIQAEATLLLNELHFKEWRLGARMNGANHGSWGLRARRPKKCGTYMIRPFGPKDRTVYFQTECPRMNESPRTSLDTHVTPPIQSYTNHTRKCVRPRFHGVKNEENGGPRSYCDGLFKSSFHLFCLPCLCCVKN